MIDSMMGILEQCPTGEFGMRVFQQHGSEGTCWNDAMYMLLFNTDELKPRMRAIMRRLMELNAAEGNLDFGDVGTEDVKLNRLALALRAEFDPRGSLAVWELLTINMQRYIQLVYMFLIDVSVRNAAPKENIKHSRLMTRRKSIQCATYSKFHDFTRPSLTYGSYGSQTSGRFIGSVNIFLKSVSPEGYIYSIHHARDDIDSEFIHGYYFEKYGHVVSMFKCNGIWTFYDNELGAIIFSPEDSAKLDASAVKEFGKIFTHDTCTYVFLLKDNEEVSVVFDYNGPPKNLSLKTVSGIGIIYYFTKRSTAAVAAEQLPFYAQVAAARSKTALAPIASANTTNNSNKEGGRRRHRKTQRKRRNARKKTRSYK
jgi:hypothetical protein